MGINGCEFSPLSSSMGLSFQATGIISLFVRKIKWLLINLQMLQMLKVTCGFWMVKYLSSWPHLVCNSGTILWIVTPACLTCSWMDALSRKKDQWLNNVKNIKHSEMQKMLNSMLSNYLKAVGLALSLTLSSVKTW